MWPQRAAPLALLALLVGTGGAAAQSALVLSPDTLYYPSETVVTLTNAGGATTAVDSIAIRIGGPRAYDVELAMPDSTHGPHYLNPFYETSFHVGAGLGPGDSALFRVLGFDPCVVCNGPGSGFGPDTLLVYSGGSAAPHAALIDLSTYVPAEPDPPVASPLRLVAYPNPTSRHLTLTFGTSRAADVEVVLGDLLGRVVRRQWLASGAPPELVVELGDLPAGRYYVRATAAGGGTATLPFVLIR